MFYVLSKTLDWLVCPLSWAFLLCLFALTANRGHSARGSAALAALTLYVFSIEPISNSLMRHLERSVEPSIRRGVTYDAVICLGGVMDHRATATWHEPEYNDAVERLITTYDLLRAGRAKNAILAGGPDAVDDPVVEGAALARQLEDWGIDSSRLFIDGTSRNTRENAVESQKIAAAHGLHSLVLVTSAFHMPRALETFRAAGLSVDTLPVDYRSFDGPSGKDGFLPRVQWLAASTHALRELVGRVVYRVAWH